jgi:hypothetical protein
LKFIKDDIIDIEPLLCNDREVRKYTRAVSRQRFGKQVPAAKNRRTAIEVLLETVFSIRSVPKVYQWDKFGEAGSNTSTVTLRVVGGDEKGSLKSETVKYGRKSQGTRTEEGCVGKGQRHIQKTDPSFRQRGRPTESRT